MELLHSIHLKVTFLIYKFKIYKKTIRILPCVKTQDAVVHDKQGTIDKGLFQLAPTKEAILILKLKKFLI